MLGELLFALWFLLPAACANVAPILVSKLPVIGQWKRPIDGGKTYRGKPVFGPHKTWLGLLSGIVAATIVFALQQSAVEHMAWARSISDHIDYRHLPTFLLGPLFGLGALGGDAIESFFKRQSGVASGHSWIPWDQIDYIIGGTLVTLPFVILSLKEYIFIFVIWFVIHLASSYVGYLTGFKERPI